MSLDARWRAVQREAQLSASLIARGVTMLGKAEHAMPGIYSQAFFALSIGFERAGKLAFVADYAMQNGGTFPSNKSLMKLGHDLVSLIPICEAAGARVDPGRSFAAKPSDPIHNAIIEVLSDFAETTRYYNLNYLDGSVGHSVDPIAEWWRKVGQPIVARHYKPSQRAKDDATGQTLEMILGDAATVFHGDEAGQPIGTMSGLVRRAGETRVVQRWGQFYVLQIARWLGSLIDALGTKGAYGQRIHPLLGLTDAFDAFVNDDAYLPSRRTWSIYPGQRGTV